MSIDIKQANEFVNTVTISISEYDLLRKIRDESAKIVDEYIVEANKRIALMIEKSDMLRFISPTGRWWTGYNDFNGSLGSFNLLADSAEYIGKDEVIQSLVDKLNKQKQRNFSVKVRNGFFYRIKFLFTGEYTCEVKIVDDPVEE